MSPSRRTRKSNTTKKSKPNRVVTEDSSDERSSDAGSVTRCICGQGLQARLPDQYFCDQCQPENHQIVKTSSGRSKRLYNAGLVSTSNTSPSLASSDKEDTSTSTSTTKRSAKRRKKATAAVTAADKAGCHSPPKTPLMEAKMEHPSPVMNTIEESPVMEERSTRSRRTKIPADTIEQGTITTTASVSAATSLIPELVKKASSSSSPSSSVSPSPATTTTTPITSTEKKSTKTKSNSNRHSSSSATPQQQILDDFGSPSAQHHHHHTTASSSSSSTPYWNFADGRPMRESSPPAKIKYPSSKMSFSDMNKRAKQIMECITKMQTEELKRLPPPTLNSKHPDNHTLSLFQEVDPQTTAPFNRPRSLSTSSTSSSLSSASTVPLLDDYTTTTTSASSSPSTPIPYKHFPHQPTPIVQQHSPEEETSIEILERISREIAKFQRKFGIVYQNQPHHPPPHHHHHQPAPHVGTNGHAKPSTTSK
ncbi:uncharacterized protein ATC70_010039 [Mucor velutinosus]|uniref:Uncharacterized protein n=1 Tax=Mucor velutinosus TaxID=708070 RepID=A0AAN7DLY0_9FUNG|nr:hypothetical protein ATC70_010039 [Mucor velutinosus]